MAAFCTLIAWAVIAIIVIFAAKGLAAASSPETPPVRSGPAPKRRPSPDEREV